MGGKSEFLIKKCGSGRAAGTTASGAEAKSTATMQQSGVMATEPVATTTATMEN